jgi:hypothetical protein
MPREGGPLTSFSPNSTSQNFLFIELGLGVAKRVWDTIAHALNSTVARYINTKINAKCYLAIRTLKPPKTTLKPFFIDYHTIMQALNSTVARYTNTKINAKCYLAIRTLKPSKILLKPPKTTFFINYHYRYVIVISRCEYNILVIVRVRGGAEDECNNQDIVRAYPGYNWLLSHKLRQPGTI